MTYVRRSLGLYLAKRSYVLGTPAGILALVVTVSIAIGLVIGIVTGLPLPPDAQDGFRYNQGVLWSLPGFLISLGALAMNRNFAMAIAFGSTRRHFWLGSAIGFVLTSAVTAAGAVALLALERATDHWFVGVRAFDVAALGDGDYLRTFATIGGLSLLSLFLGALFGTVFRAFGAELTFVLGVALGLLAIGVVAAAVWQWQAVGPVVTGLGAWLAPALAVALAALAAAGSYAANRAATV